MRELTDDELITHDLLTIQSPRRADVDYVIHIVICSYV